MASFKVISLYAYGCFDCMRVYALHVCLVPVEARKYRQIPGPGLTNDCEPSRGLWELNPGPLQKQSVLSTETSLQPENLFY